MVRTLREFYGLQPQPPSDLFQFLVWEVLSERALPARRDLAWQALRRIPALTPDAMFRAPARDLLEAIGLAGPHREEKVERLRGIIGEFKRHRDLLDQHRLQHVGTLRAGRALARLEHVHPSVRARAHLFVLGANVLPLDDEIMRVVGRLMDTPGTHNRPATRRWLLHRLIEEAAELRDAVVYLRHHAQQTCVTVAPHCGVCPLRDRCASVQ